MWERYRALYDIFSYCRYTDKSKSLEKNSDAFAYEDLENS